MIKVRFATITCYAELMVLRDIRNWCRKFMTNSTQYISAEQQSTWFGLPASTRGVPFLVSTDDQESLSTDPETGLYNLMHSGPTSVIGYGLIRPRAPGSAWLSGGLDPEFRGKSLGHQLFTGLVDICQGLNQVPYLQVREDNARALKLYKSLGFDTTDFTDGIYTMVLHP